MSYSDAEYQKLLADIKKTASTTDDFLNTIKDDGKQKKGPQENTDSPTVSASKESTDIPSAIITANTPVTAELTHKEPQKSKKKKPKQTAVIMDSDDEQESLEKPAEYKKKTKKKKPQVEEEIQTFTPVTQAPSVATAPSSDTSSVLKQDLTEPVGPIIQQDTASAPATTDNDSSSIGSESIDQDPTVDLELTREETSPATSESFTDIQAETSIAIVTDSASPSSDSIEDNSAPASTSAAETSLSTQEAARVKSEAEIIALAQSVFEVQEKLRENLSLLESDITKAKADNFKVRKYIVEAKETQADHTANLPEPKLFIFSVTDELKAKLALLRTYAEDRGVLIQELPLKLKADSPEIRHQKRDRLWLYELAKAEEEASSSYRVSGLNSQPTEILININKLDQLRLEYAITSGYIPKERECVYVDNNPKNPKNATTILAISNYHVVPVPALTDEDTAFLQQLTYELGAYNDLIKILQAQPVPAEFDLATIPNFNISNLFPHIYIAKHVGLEQFSQNIDKLTPDPILQAQLYEAQAKSHAAQTTNPAPVDDNNSKFFEYLLAYLNKLQSQLQQNELSPAQLFALNQQLQQCLDTLDSLVRDRRIDRSNPSLPNVQGTLERLQTETKNKLEALTTQKTSDTSTHSSTLSIPSLEASADQQAEVSTDTTIVLGTSIEVNANSTNNEESAITNPSASLPFTSILSQEHQDSEVIIQTPQTVSTLDSTGIKAASENATQEPLTEEPTPAFAAPVLASSMDTSTSTLPQQESIPQHAAQKKHDSEITATNALVSSQVSENGAETVLNQAPQTGTTLTQEHVDNEPKSIMDFIDEDPIVNEFFLGGTDHLDLYKKLSEMKQRTKALSQYTHEENRDFFINQYQQGTIELETLIKINRKLVQNNKVSTLTVFDELIHKPAGNETITLAELDAIIDTYNKEKGRFRKFFGTETQFISDLKTLRDHVKNPKNAGDASIYRSDIELLLCLRDQRKSFFRNGVVQNSLCFFNSNPTENSHYSQTEQAIKSLREKFNGNQLGSVGESESSQTRYEVVSNPRPARTLSVTSSHHDSQRSISKASSGVSPNHDSLLKCLNPDTVRDEIVPF